jgi:hypothetical protein
MVTWAKIVDISSIRIDAAFKWQINKNEERMRSSIVRIYFNVVVAGLLNQN